MGGGPVWEEIPLSPSYKWTCIYFAKNRKISHKTRNRPPQRSKIGAFDRQNFSTYLSHQFDFFGRPPIDLGTHEGEKSKIFKKWPENPKSEKNDFSDLKLALFDPPPLRFFFSSQTTPNMSYTWKKIFATATPLKNRRFPKNKLLVRCFFFPFLKTVG